MLYMSLKLQTGSRISYLRNTQPRQPTKELAFQSKFALRSRLVMIHAVLLKSQITTRLPCLSLHCKSLSLSKRVTKNRLFKTLELLFSCTLQRFCYLHRRLKQQLIVPQVNYIFPKIYDVHRLKYNLLHYTKLISMPSARANP